MTKHSGGQIAKETKHDMSLIDGMRARTVLIVDPELGFVFWLGQTLDSAGYDALPAKSCEDAAELLRQLDVGVDLLVVGSACPGAPAFSDTLRLSQKDLKVIVALSDTDEPGPAFPRAEAFVRKFSHLDDASRAEWLETTEAVLVHDCATN